MSVSVMLTASMTQWEEVDRLSSAELRRRRSTFRMSGAEWRRLFPSPERISPARERRAGCCCIILHNAHSAHCQVWLLCDVCFFPPTSVIICPCLFLSSAILFTLLFSLCRLSLLFLACHCCPSLFTLPVSHTPYLFLFLLLCLSFPVTVPLPFHLPNSLSVCISDLPLRHSCISTTFSHAGF